MSSSFVGNGPGSTLLRTKRSCCGRIFCPGNIGSQREAGASVDSSAKLRGPVRRSYRPAIVFRQLAAAIARSASLSDTCTSFSASANVETVTSGPTAGPVPNADGEPGGKSADTCALLRDAAAAPSKVREVAATNCLPDFDMYPPHRIVTRAQQGLLGGGSSSWLGLDVCPIEAVAQASSAPKRDWGAV